MPILITCGLHIDTCILHVCYMFCVYFQLPGLSVQRDWYEKLGDVKITHDNVQQFVRYNRGLDLVRILPSHHIASYCIYEYSQF